MGGLTSVAHVGRDVVHLLNVSTTNELVRSNVSSGIATITLDSSSNRNALSGRLVSELLDSLQQALDADDVHAIVLTATGTVFCSGADLTDPPSNERGSRFSYPDVLSTIMTSPKPVVAVLNGHARAGGLGLVAVCDIAIAPSDANFAFTEVRLGVVPAIIAVVCRRVMDRRAFSRYSITGETFTAQDAVTAGLLTAVADRNEIDATVARVLDDLHRTEPTAVAQTKVLLDVLAEMTVEEGFAHASELSARFFDSANGREGIAAFRERRPPSWAW